MQGGRRGSWQQPQPQSQVGAAVGSAAALSASATSSQSLLLWALQTPGATQTGVDWPGLGELTWGTLWRVSDGHGGHPGSETS